MSFFLFASAAMERRLRLVLDKTVACGMLKRASASRRLKDIMVVFSVCFSSDGKKIASGSDDKTVRVWHVETGECIKTFEGHNGSVNSVCFSSDGKKIASGSLTIRFACGMLKRASALGQGKISMRVR